VSIVPLIGEGWQAMRSNGLRTFLTMLGMVIGVGAVILMLAVGQGAQLTVNESIASMGSNLFIVLSGSSTSGGLRSGSGGAPTLTLGDLLAITELTEVEAAAPALPTRHKWSTDPTTGALWWRAPPLRCLMFATGTSSKAYLLPIATFAPAPGYCLSARLS